MVLVVVGGGWWVVGACTGREARTRGSHCNNSPPLTTGTRSVAYMANCHILDAILKKRKRGWAPV